MAVLLPPPVLQFFDDDGNPLSGGKVYTYAAGTTTPKATFTDASGQIAATNPVVLDSAGRATIWVLGTYKFVVTDAEDNVIRTTDNVQSFNGIAEAADAFFQSFSGDGAKISFTLSDDLGADEKAIQVFIDGAVQSPASFSLSGKNLIFASAPPAGSNNIYVFAPSKLVGAASSSAQMAEQFADAAETHASAAEQSAQIADNAADTATAVLSDPRFVLVADNLDDVLIVGENIAGVNSVASDIGNINAVAMDIENINAVAEVLGDVDFSNVNIVAANIDDVNAVAANIGDLNIAAQNIDDIAYVGQNISAVVTADANMEAIIDAPSQASAAAASAGFAAESAAQAGTARDYAHDWASAAEDAPVDDGVHPTGYSAYHWAQKAFDAVDAGVTDGDKGEITVSNGGTQFRINNGVVSTAKLANNAVTAQKLFNITGSAVLGRASGTGNVQTLDPATARGVLNLGSAAIREAGTEAGDVPVLNSIGTLSRAQCRLWTERVVNHNTPSATITINMSSLIPSGLEPRLIEIGWERLVTESAARVYMQLATAGSGWLNAGYQAGVVQGASSEAFTGGFPINRSGTINQQLSGNAFLRRAGGVWTCQTGGGTNNSGTGGTAGGGVIIRDNSLTTQIRFVADGGAVNIVAANITYAIWV